MMQEESEQPPRQPTDGPVSAEVVGEGRYRLCVTTDGVRQTIVMSGHNAWRAFGLLAMILRITLPGKLRKEIKL